MAKADCMYADVSKRERIEFILCKYEMYNGDAL